ncbi:hypothetical protein [Streptomyces griseorubiginosus]|uniref:hypothetical protein n=1 Tax=Streptomyces griseorubiginosus TaxID=67304 RepID=UPI0036EE099A
MTELAADRELQAAQAQTDAGSYPDGSTEQRFATQTAAELRDHADQLRRGINPYEGDTELWIPRKDGR